MITALLAFIFAVVLYMFAGIVATIVVFFIALAFWIVAHAKKKRIAQLKPTPLICPMCHSTQVKFKYLEDSRAATGAATSVYGVGVASGGVKVNRRNVAYCVDCNYSFDVLTDADIAAMYKKQQSNEGCAGLVTVLCAIILIAILVSCRGSNSSSSTVTSSEQSSTTSGAQTAWANETTPISDFDIEIKDGALYLQDYRGENAALRIAPEYTVNGDTYSVCLDEFIIDSANVTSVILEDGITSFRNSIFNGTLLQSLYIPQSISVVYDASLSGVDNTLSTICYGGTEDEWNAILQHYEVQSAKEKWDSEDYEGAGTALADKLNQFIDDGLDLSKAKFFYNVSIESLP